MEVRKMYETNKLISRVCIAIILAALTIIILSLSVLMNTKHIRNLQTQINELKFEQSYLEYVKDDGERQYQ